MRVDPGSCDRSKEARVFDRLANHLTVLADQVEKAILERKSETGK